MLELYNGVIGTLTAISKPYYSILGKDDATSIANMSFIKALETYTDDSTKIKTKCSKFNSWVALQCRGMLLDACKKLNASPTNMSTCEFDTSVTEQTYDLTDSVFFEGTNYNIPQNKESEDKDEVEKLMECLTPMQKKIITARYYTHQHLRVCALAEIVAPQHSYEWFRRQLNSALDEMRIYAEKLEKNQAMA